MAATTPEDDALAPDAVADGALMRAGVDEALAELMRLEEGAIRRELLLEPPTELLEDMVGVGEEVEEGIAIVEGEARTTWTVVVEVGPAAAVLAPASACSAAKATGKKIAVARRALEKCILFIRYLCRMMLIALIVWIFLKDIGVVLIATATVVCLSVFLFVCWDMEQIFFFFSLFVGLFDLTQSIEQEKECEWSWKRVTALVRSGEKRVTALRPKMERKRRKKEEKEKKKSASVTN